VVSTPRPLLRLRSVVCVCSRLRSVVGVCSRLRSVVCVCSRLRSVVGVCSRLRSVVRHPPNVETRRHPRTWKRSRPERGNDKPPPNVETTWRTRPTPPNVETSTRPTPRPRSGLEDYPTRPPPGHHPRTCQRPVITPERGNELETRGCSWDSRNFENSGVSVVGRRSDRPAGVIL
jgi:hypothetical protein